MYPNADRQYQELLSTIINEDNLENTRNHEAFSYVFGFQCRFNKFPLVTIRKTAWKKALTELEWFMSGESKCPDDLANTWWKGQLSPNDCYFDGYGKQLRRFTTYQESFGEMMNFDQIIFGLNALKSNPNSRRLCFTTWNPADMADITITNDNPNTPTTCHLSFAQLFVVKGKLYLHTYNRSQDCILGTPHNWVQHWALLTYFAVQSDLKVGGLTYTFGNAHIYNEPTHIAAAQSIINEALLESEIELIYEPTSKEFKASDFSILGEIPSPIVKGKINLL